MAELRLSTADLKDDDALKFSFAYYDKHGIWTGDFDNAQLTR